MIMINVVSVDYVERDVCHGINNYFCQGLMWSPSDALYGSMMVLQDHISEVHQFLHVLNLDTLFLGYSF